MTNPSPCLRIRTSFTSVGKRISCGSRTAWLAPLRNMDARRATPLDTDLAADFDVTDLAFAVRTRFSCAAFRDARRVYCSLHYASYGIQCLMFEVKRTDAFDAWLKALRDSKSRSKIQARIDRLANGNPGDVGPIGQGLSELRN